MALLATPVGAQSRAASTPHIAKPSLKPVLSVAAAVGLRDDKSPVKVRPLFASDRREADRSAVDVVARTLVVRGAPRGFHVVRVPVPAEIAFDRSASYYVLTAGNAPILGRLEGTVAAGSGSRAVNLTVGVPNDARAGLSAVGSVVFASPGAPTVEVPIALDVAPSRRVELRVNEALRAVRPGERFALKYQIVNLGNALDTVAVRVALPQGWRADDGDGFSAIVPGASVHRTIMVSVPRDIGRGSLTLRLTAYAQGHAVANADAVVELVGADGRTSSTRDGATLRIGAAATRGPWQGTPVGATYSLSGHVSDDVQVSASAVTAPTAGSAAQMSLARSGLAQVPASVAIWTPSWRVAGGPVGGNLTDLTGTTVGGQGASLAITRKTWGASAIAARPTYGATRYGTNALFGQIAAQAGAMRLSTSVSSLRESLGPIGDPRRLDAVSTGIEIGSMLTSRAASEIAYRRFDGGSGLGASASMSLRSTNGTLDLRGTHAAGGSRAFARGTNEFSFSASRQLSSRLGLSASGWRLGDDAPGARALQSDGWSFAGSARLASATSLSLGGRRFGYATSAAAGRFGSADQSMFGVLQTRVGALNASFDGTFGVRSRSVTSGALENVSITDRASTSRYATTMSVNSRAGTIGVSGAVSDNGTGLGIPARQLEAGANLDQVPLLTLRFMRVVAGASASRVTSFVTPGKWLTTMRGTLGAQLPLGVNVSIEAERNPLYFVSVLGAERSQKWMYVARIERSIGLPRIGRGQRSEGVVFVDADGDGRRDIGEEGMAGLIVRRGGETGVTGRDGRYRFMSTSTEPVSLDVRSLPLGWISTPRTEVAGGDIALVALSSVDVYLRTEAVDSTRVTREDLGKVIVTARDSTGRTWVARSVSPGRATFEALPRGRYETAVDFSQTTEPLRVSDDTPAFSVGSGAVPAIHITVEPRPLRFPVAGRATPVLPTKAVGDGNKRAQSRQDRHPQ